MRWPTRGSRGREPGFVGQKKSIARVRGIVCRNARLRNRREHRDRSGQYSREIRAAAIGRDDDLGILGGQREAEPRGLDRVVRIEVRYISRSQSVDQRGAGIIPQPKMSRSDKGKSVAF